MSHTPRYDHASYLEKVIRKENLKDTLKRALHELRPRANDFDAIAFRGMSGALLAPILALALNKTIIVVRKERSVNDHSDRVCEGDQATARYIIVDDCASSGRTIKTVYAEIKKWNPTATCIGLYFYEDGGWSTYRLLTIDNPEPWT